jgi:hypothetical protein
MPSYIFFLAHYGPARAFDRWRSVALCSDGAQEYRDIPVRSDGEPVELLSSPATAVSASAPLSASDDVPPSQTDSDGSVASPERKRTRVASVSEA